MLRGVADPEERADEAPDSLTKRVFSAAEHRSIPLGTIVTTVAVVLVAGLLVTVMWVLRGDLLLLGAAAFIAVLLAQPVAALERSGMRRSYATSIVFFICFCVLAGVAYLLGSPLVSHVHTFAHDLPRLVRDAQHGRGLVGRIIARLHLHNWVVKYAPNLSKYAKDLAGPALTVGAAAISTLFRLITIAFIAFFLLLDLPRIWGGFLSLLPRQYAHRFARVAHDASTGVTGYMAGNALTSIIAGVIVYFSLLLLHVPFAGLLAIWVALVDFIPIVGGLLAGLPTVAIALFHSPVAGISMFVIFVVYQQVENHVLNPIIMSKTVKMSPLLNLLAVVIGATLGGRVGGVFGTLIGALVGIPIGSALQVIVRELRHPELLDDPEIDVPGGST